MLHTQPSIIAKHANISPSAAPEVQSAITNECEQLLPHTGGTEECRRRQSADHYGNPTQGQLSGGSAVISTSKPRCDIACSPAYPILTIGTASTVKSSPFPPGFPKSSLGTFKSEPGSRSSHVERPLYSYRLLSRLQYFYSISR